MSIVEAMQLPGITAQAAQGGIASLSERSDGTFSVCWLSGWRRMKLRRAYEYFRQERIEMRSLVPKGIFVLAQLPDKLGFINLKQKLLRQSYKL